MLALADQPGPSPTLERHRLVFVGGLHRSGTTPVARWLASHPQVSDLRDSGVPEDEGQHLQDVYPAAARHGGPGRFAFHPSAQLTDRSPLVCADSREQLWSAWAPHWDLEQPVLVEKSPPNLIRMRFLQALFPGSRFVIVVRHPLAVSYATAKWWRVKKPWRRKSIASLLRHWEVAHERLLDDLPGVEEVALVRYEDLIADPHAVLERLFSFIGVEPFAGRWEVRSNLNAAYLERWAEDVSRRARGARLRSLAGSLEPRAKAFGYSLEPPWTLPSPASELARYLR